MARKSSAIVQPNLRIREELRRKLAKEAEKHRVSLNAEMTDRLERSLDQDATRSIDVIAADIANNWARFGSTLHDLNKQGDLLRAAKALVEQIERGGSKDAITKAAEAMKQAIKVIEIEAARLPHRMHTTGSD